MSPVSATIASVTSDDIFAGIDDLPWADVEHCWGPAVDTPQYLRDLRSPSDTVRDEAWYELEHSIYHLGARYPATQLAVPFLVRLALARDTPDRDRVLHLLMTLAIGYDTDHFPAGFDVDAQRKGLADLRAHTPESWERRMDGWVAAATTEQRRQRRERNRSHITLAGSIRAAESEVLAYEAVLAGVPVLRRLLDDADPSVRAATAYLLAWFPEAVDESITALTALLASEPSSSVVINALIALGLLPGASIAVLLPYLESRDEPIAWAAAGAMVAAGAPDEAVIARLGDALRADPRLKPGLLYRYGEFSSFASKCLAAIPDDMGPLAIDTAIAAFGSRADTRSAAKAAVALAFARPARTPRPAFADLDGQQQRVLRALVETGPEPWRLNNELDLLMSPHGMPRYYKDLHAYVEASCHD